MKGHKYFVIFNNLKTGRFIPMLDADGESIATFGSATEAAVEGIAYLPGDELGFEVFMVGGGVC